MSYPAYFNQGRATTGSQSPFMTGGKTGEKPTLVQSKAWIGNSPLTVTLDAAPTPGNMLVAMGSHWNNNPAAVNGYTMRDMVNGSTYAGWMLAWKIAQPGESAVQTPFTNGSAANTLVVFEVSGAQAISLMNAVKELNTSPVTVTGFDNVNDLIVGVFVQQLSNAAFTLSGDTSTAIENITANPGRDGPVRLQSFSFTPTDETPTVSATNSGRMLGLAVRVSSRPYNEGRTIISDFASAAALGTRFGVGNLYFEVAINAATGTPGVGVVSYWYGFSLNPLGTGTDNVVYNTNGQVRYNNTTLATLAAYTTGDRISVAYDRGNSLIWFRVNNGSWNNDGLANPATGVGGISMGAFTHDRVSPAVSFTVTGTAMTAYLDTSEFAYSVPSGFYSVAEVVVNAARTVIDPEAYVPQTPPAYPSDWCAMTELPEDNHSRSVSFPAGPVKVIAGEVREDDVGVEGKLVRVYNKRTGDFVGEARTNATGDFVIPAQDPNLPHVVIAFDDPTYNAKVYDNVLPS